MEKDWRPLKLGEMLEFESMDRIINEEILEELEKIEQCGRI